MWVWAIGLLVIAGTGLVLSFVLSLVAQRPLGYEQQFVWLFWVNVGVAALLVGVLLVAAVRLAVRLRQRKFGSRLLFKLAGIFALVGVLPGALGRTNGRGTPVIASVTVTVIIAIVLGAFTNDFHHLLWTDVVPRGPGDVLPTFVCGPLFWINWTYAYLLIAIGTVWLALSVRHFAGRYRVQLWLLILGVVAPWAGNLLYILGQVPLPGLDMTPVAFAATGACFIAAVFHTKQRP